MAKVDENKFIEVFVDVDAGSIKMSPMDPVIYDYVYEQIDPKMFSAWNKYLTHKAEEFGDNLDAYDEWYDNLKFEDLDEYDLHKFLLPEEKIVVKIPHQNAIMLNIISLMREFYDRTYAIVGKNPNIAFGYTMSSKSRYMGMYVCAIEGYNPRIYSQAKKIHIECEDRWRDMMNEYNKTSTTIVMLSQGRSKNSAIYYNKEKSNPDAIEDAIDNAKMFEKNNIANFRIAEVSNDNFRLKKGRTSSIDIDEFVTDLFKNVEEESKSNIEDIRVGCIF